MISADQSSDMLGYRLRKLALSGASSNELASKIQSLLETERSQKGMPEKSQQDFMLPLFGRRKAHLNLV